MIELGQFYINGVGLLEESTTAVVDSGTTELTAPPKIH